MSAEQGQLQSGETEEATSSFPDRRYIDVSRDPNPGVPNHALPDGAPRHPLIDLSRDPNPGKADHALPDDDEE